MHINFLSVLKQKYIFIKKISQFSRMSYCNFKILMKMILNIAVIVKIENNNFVNLYIII